MDGRLLRKPENVDGSKYPDYCLSMKRDITGRGIPDLTPYIDEEENLNQNTKTETEQNREKEKKTKYCKKAQLKVEKKIKILMQKIKDFANSQKMQ